MLPDRHDDDGPTLSASRDRQPDQIGQRTVARGAQLGKSTSPETVSNSAESPPDERLSDGRGSDVAPLTRLPRSGEHEERIGRFVIRERLGEGAFGIVYRAYDPQ